MTPDAIRAHLGQRVTVTLITGKTITGVLTYGWRSPATTGPFGGPACDVFTVTPHPTRKTTGARNLGHRVIASIEVA